MSMENVVKTYNGILIGIDQSKKVASSMGSLIQTSSKYCETYVVSDHEIIYYHAIAVIKNLMKKYPKLEILKNDNDVLYTDSEDMKYSRFKYVDTMVVLKDKATIMKITHTKVDPNANRSNRAPVAGRYGSRDYDELQILWFGLNAHKYKDAFMKQLKKLFDKDNDYITVYKNERNISQSPKRPEHIMVQPEYFEIKTILEKFVAERDLYEDLGLVYKNSFLLYGSPGTGKSTIITTLANVFNASILKVDLSSHNWTEDMGIVNRNYRNGKLTFVLIEDIDLYLDVNRENDIKSNTDIITGSNNNDTNNQRSELSSMKKTVLGDLFQFMDGIESQHGAVYFLTTNYINKLDKALIRPGRINHKIEIKLLNRELQDKMIKNFGLTREELDDDIPEECSSAILSVYLLDRKMGIIHKFSDYEK